jgi:ubiquitin carboxyl-terminal hydrolase 8
MWRQKLQTGVLFPLKDLDMTEYVKGPKSSSYSLFSISNHYGTMHGGHYTAYCLNSYDKRWYKFDDQLVTEMSSAGNVVVRRILQYLTYYLNLYCLQPDWLMAFSFPGSPLIKIQKESGYKNLGLNN